MKRAILIFSGVLFLLIAGLVAAGGWIVTTEQGLRFAISKAQIFLRDNTTQVLDVELEHGTLRDGLSITSLSWNDGEKFVDIAGLQIKLDWSGILANTLVVNSLSAKSVRLVMPPSEDNEPFSLPDNIDLPLDVRIESLQITEVVFNDLVVDQIAGKASLIQNRFDLQQLDLSVEDTQLKSRATVVLSKPYAVDGLITANRTFDAVQLDAKLNLAGSLERLELLLNATGQDTARSQVNQSAEIDAVVTPFKPVMVEKVRLLTQNFNPRQWFDSAPMASLTIQGLVQPNADFTQTQGNFSVKNAAPSTLQSGGLPLLSLSALIDLQTSGGLFEKLKLDLNDAQFSDGKRGAGRVSMNVQWESAPQLPDAKSGEQSMQDLLMQGAARFSLQARALDLSVFAALPQKHALNVELNGVQQANLLRVNQLKVQDGEALLEGYAQVGWGGKLPVSLQFQFKQLNPALYVPDANPLLQGNLNGAINFKGELSPTGDGKSLNPMGELLVNVDESTLANAPLKVSVQAIGNAQKLSKVMLDVAVAGNTAKADGSYGTQADFVNVDVNFSQLARLGQLIDRKLGGTAQLKGKLRGLDGDFSGEGKIQIQQLRLDNAIQVDSVAGDFSLGSAANSVWAGDIQVRNVRQPGAPANWVNTLNVQLTGTRSSHGLSAVFDSGLTTFSRQRPIKGEFGMRGGIQDIARNNKTAVGWKGAITAFRLEGMWLPARSFSLQNPAPLTLSAEFTELLDLNIKGEDSSLISNRVFQVAGREIRVEGGMPSFAFPRLSPILRKQLTLEPKDLVAKVAWRYVANPNKVDGHVDLTHVSGGLQVLEDSQIDVDIRKMQANLDFNRDAATLNLDIEANEFGVVSANLRLPVEQNSVTKSWELAGNKPMQGAVAAGFTELNWLGPLISGGVRTSGTGQVAMAIGGTANNPDVQGRLFAMDLDVFQLDQGVRLEDGNVVVDFTTDKASIDTLEFTVYNRRVPKRQIEQLGPLIQGNGKITATGQWNLTGLDGEIQVKLDKVPLLQRPDRWLMVNSQATVQQPNVEGKPLKIRGEINALGAYFEMPESGPQTLGDDVFIKGRSEVVGAGLPIDLQLQANLGNLFYLNAEGLRTRLTGGLRLVMLEGVGGSGQRRSGRRLTATGTIQAVDGTYRAYGQDLTIDRGVVNFQGPLDNPGLNVRAVRKGVAVEAGVEVTGTAQRPKVTLVSEPAVPDSEKLSWMIIGRGSNSADRDSTLLLTAAAAIFGDDDDSTTRKIARSLGIDDLNLSTGSLTAADSRAVGSKVAIAPGADNSASILGSDDPLLSQRIISLGKRFSDEVYLSFDQSVTTAASILKLNYQYSRQLSFIARTGADNAVDVLYQLSFD
ncbi:MAG: translocation/assembly module TamB domain-containing protein [Limnobacter sp.]|uniref:translocation/assembly module TamB domain-containing protein n=1 Tax=Limnobacter sp. TaxID=2003368 RepID=UPI0022C6B8BF|nr:translocation/assembly module TamB domain-containing protein [Limnobacter sp.]MCZ8016941.1 translocation/assembly module TamB domain-containing protein [Limnobacter sp.]